MKPKPCPFCGSKTIIPIRLMESSSVYGMKCDNCDAQGPPTWDHYTEEKAVELWNKRGRKQWTI